ncbi:MAG: hypothetical protein GOP50_03200 [Candidatus Heimdallarchaeota archaeon]|nr:hypothetical protein [Candidatus Heimdallarchaeota archaeon]
MKIKLRPPNEWGYYLNPETFEIRETIGDIPNNVLVVIRKKEYRAEISRSVFRTFYATISNNMLVYLSKKDTAKKLTKLCVQFMLEKGEIPPRVIIDQKRIENKPFELIFHFRTFATFPLKFSDNIFEDEEQKEHITTLINSIKTDFIKSREDNSWYIEYAPNGRTLCKKCKKQIKYKEMRITEIFSKIEQKDQRFYHFKCTDWSKLTSNLVKGIDKLTEDDQNQVKKKLKH